VRDNRRKGIHRIAPEVPGFEVTAQMALVRMRDRTLDCSSRVRTNLIMHQVVKKRPPRVRMEASIKGAKVVKVL
jgi:hypothetical protein